MIPQTQAIVETFWGVWSTSDNHTVLYSMDLVSWALATLADRYGIHLGRY